MAFHQEFLGKGDGGQHLYDFFGGESVAVRIDRVQQRISKLLTLCGAHRFQNRLSFRGGIDDVLRALSSLLAQTDVNGRQSEGRRLHDAAAGVSEENVRLAE